MRLKFILSKNLELFYLRFLCVKVFPFVIHVAERGFPEVADWLTVQWSFLVMSWGSQSLGVGLLIVSESVAS